MTYALSPLIAVANRCLVEPASRALDAAIHCTVLGVTDANPMSSAAFIEARARRLFLIDHAAIRGWADAPPYTADLGCAQLLVPEGRSTIAREPRIVCATALMARAMLDSPRVPLQGRRKHWLG